MTVNRSSNGVILAPGFAGFSYEKSHVNVPFFNAGNTALATLFQRLGHGILRVGGNSVDKTTWNATGSGLTAGSIAPADIDRLAGFLKAAGWQVIYGLNFATNSPGQMASEAAYAAKSLGDRLYGFEIGNEPDLYHSNGLRPTTYTYSEFMAEWEAYAAAIRAQVPGVVLTGPASASNTNGYTLPFAAAESAKIDLLTQHYYRANGQAPTSTIDLLLEPDPSLSTMLQALKTAASASKISGAYRIAEANSFYNGGAPNVSDAFGTALWAIDFLFTNAASGSSGVNFHGGGKGSGYTPIADDGTHVVEVRPEYYGIYLFSMAASGTLLATQVDAGGLALSAYAVAASDGSTAVLLVNKDRSKNADMTVDLGAAYTRATLTPLTGPSLDSPTGELLQGAPISADGSWNPTATATVSVRGHLVAFAVPASSAALVRAE
ncbi:MAG TPA: glycoside hydrolase family 44 protein [Anaeromyxobacteraceae bacterium]|nr:glycoside hydrolase family 44 protein [Anaeromyxobacteraceae bacterium]